MDVSSQGHAFVTLYVNAGTWSLTLMY